MEEFARNNETELNQNSSLGGVIANHNQEAESELDELESQGDSMESLMQVLVPTRDGAQIPLTQVASIEYVRGPQVIKSEDTFLVGYVIFDKKPQFAEVDVVEQAARYLKSRIDTGELVLPAGVSYTFAGSYENQVRASKRLRIVLPLALMIIFLILYFQFKSTSTTLLVFSGILVEAREEGSDTSTTSASTPPRSTGLFIDAG